MTAVIVIPSRYGSKRFPGKPLHPIKGISLLERTWLIAKAVKHIDEVYVATDDERIFNHCQSFGGKAIMTPESCENGTERAYEAVRSLTAKPDIVINLQGDAVLTPPWAIQALIDTMIADPSINLGTTATALTIEQYETMKNKKANGQVGGTLVTFDLNGNALYFSKTMIPYLRDPVAGQPPGYRHIGLYAYRMGTLEHYLTLKPSPLEQAEKLEQLRALENGIAIKVVLVDYKGRTHWAVDSPDDAIVVESIIEKEGELIEAAQAAKTRK